MNDDQLIIRDDAIRYHPFLLRYLIEAKKSVLVTNDYQRILSERSIRMAELVRKEPSTGKGCLVSNS